MNDLQRLVIAVYRLREVAEKFATSHLPNEVPQVEADVLLMLAHSGPLSIAEVARRRHISKQSAFMTIRKFRKKGWVFQGTQGVWITNSGLTYAESVRKARNAAGERLVAYFKAGELQKAERTISKLAGLFDAVLLAGEGEDVENT